MTINSVCYICIKNCRESWEDDHRSRRPSTSLTKKPTQSNPSCGQIENCCNKKEQNIRMTIFQNLTQNVGMRCFSARHIPRHLTIEQTEPADLLQHAEADENLMK